MNKNSKKANGGGVRPIRNRLRPRPNVNRTSQPPKITKPQVQIPGGNNVTADIPDLPVNPSYTIKTPLGNYNQTPYAHSIFIQKITLNGNPISRSNNWVGAFNNGILCGATLWNSNECNGGVCDLLIYGNSEYVSSYGYPLTGDRIDFKFFDSSRNKIIDSNNLEFETNWDFTWSPITFTFIKELNVIGGLDRVRKDPSSTNIEMKRGGNLKRGRK